MLLGDCWPSCRLSRMSPPLPSTSLQPNSLVPPSSPPYNNGRLLHKGAIFSSLFFWLLYSDVRTSGSPQHCP